MGRTRSIGGMALATALVVVIVMAATGAWPRGLSVRNPFSTETKVRDQSALLLELRDVSRYEAASGQFQVLIDVEEDIEYVPSWIAGEHTTFIAEGDVQAVIDFGGITTGGVRVSDDQASATITLPSPSLTAPRIDPENTRVMSQEKGVVNRLGDAFSGGGDHDQPLYELAAKKIASAARRSTLAQRAQTNTTQMLTALLADLGYETVTVRFSEP